MLLDPALAYVAEAAWSMKNSGPERLGPNLGMAADLLLFGSASGVLLACRAAGQQGKTGARR